MGLFSPALIRGGIGGVRRARAPPALEGSQRTASGAQTHSKTRVHSPGAMARVVISGCVTLFSTENKAQPGQGEGYMGIWRVMGRDADASRLAKDCGMHVAEGASGPLQVTFLPADQITDLEAEKQQHSG